MITPMVARIEPLPFDREGWLFELKWDVSLLKTPSALLALNLELRWNYIPGAMRELIFSLLYSLSCGLRTPTHLHLEIIALRHQLGILQRKVPVRPRLKMTDRCFESLCPDSGPIGAGVSSFSSLGLWWHGIAKAFAFTGLGRAVGESVDRKSIRRYESQFKR